MHVRNDVRLGFASDRGAHRADNQDDFILYEPEDDDVFARRGRLIAIADGMGGETAGGEASRIALRSFLAAWLDSPQAVSPSSQCSEGAAPEKAPSEGALRTAFNAAGKALDEALSRNRRLQGMGTTLTAFALSACELTGVHVGDSRCLLLQNGRSRWLTSLHTSPLHEHRLTRALVAGQQAQEPEFFSCRLQVGDRILLMSDGFWRALSEAEILATIGSCPIEEAIPTLLLRARQVDGSDNASLLILEYVGDAGLLSSASRSAEGSAEHVAADADSYAELQEFALPASGPLLRAPQGPGLLARLWPWALLGFGLGGLGYWLWG